MGQNVEGSDTTNDEESLKAKYKNTEHIIHDRQLPVCIKIILKQLGAAC